MVKVIGNFQILLEEQQVLLILVVTDLISIMMAQIMDLKLPERNGQMGHLQEFIEARIHGITAGAKWTNGTSSGIYRSENTRYAYQAIAVSPNREYILEYEYAIKNDNDENGGAKIVGEILDGHFADGADGVASSDAGPIVRNEGDKLEGKGNFTVVRQAFTANATGSVSILIWGETKQDAYVDNVKVYPAE